jgi:RHS repeat-associated protein
MAEDSPMTQGGQDSTQEKSPFTAPLINLPKGGGAIRAIGEKFTANAATGTGSLSVPIALSSGRGGFGPQLSLTYDSGSGNGPFGIGWNLRLPSITRKTDKGLPRYGDGEESDIFLLTSTEDLVPVLKQAGHDHWVPDEFERDGYRVRRYRPRIEGLFSRIERWTRLADGDAHWRSISKDNILTVYGRTANERILDPRDPSRVFSWLICESFDDKGNAVHYEYVAENEVGVDLDRPNERNRVRSANRYLKRIRYGNRKPLLLDVTLPSFRKSHVPLPELQEADWMFEAVFDYGDVDYAQEEPDPEGCVWVHATPHARPGSHWPVRKDPFSTYRSGFEVRTYRLCRRVLMFHHFPQELAARDYLVRSTEFEFHEKPLGSFISRVVQSGYRLHAGSRYLKKSRPALDLAFTSSPLEDPHYRAYRVHEVDPENLPGGIDQDHYKWLDLNGEGISGVLTEQGDAWFYKPNAGRGRFRPIEVVSPQPSLAALSKRKQQLLDLDGDGNLNLVELSSPTPGFYERTLENGWGSFRAFRSLPVLDWEDPNLRFVDVTGDGIADVLITEDNVFTWHPSLVEPGFNVRLPGPPTAGPGWGAAVRVPVPHHEREGPHVVFADGTQSIYLADMSGDGLSDIVRIRNGEVCYWPNTGYGTFGRKVTMDNSPWFEDPDLFDQKRIKLADTDGSGTTDILYLGGDGINVFLNETGNGWSTARELPQFAAANDQTSVSVVDFLGRGTMCLLWSSSLPADAQRPLRFVDLMNGQKPHLLTHIRNNLGAETRIEYASSTEFYLADQAAGTPWVTRLPFPVHVVKRVETFDYISRNRFVSSYTYHHGFFDGVEREFRGFGRVDQLDTEEFASLTRSGTFPVGDNIRAESNVPPVLIKTWFHTGAFLGAGRVSRQLAHEYWQEPGLTGSEQQAMLLDDTILPGDLAPEEAREACRALKGSTLRQETYALDGKEESPRPYTVTEGNLTIKVLQPRGRNRHAVFLTHARESLSFNYERKLYLVDGRRRADPRVTQNVTLEVDDFGNVLKSVNVAYGRRFPDRSSLLTDADHEKQRAILLTFARNRYTNPVRQSDAYRIPLAAETRLYELIHVTPWSSKSGVTNLFRFHELAEQVALASDGMHDLPYEDVHAKGAGPAAPYRRLLKRSRMRYRSNALDRILPLGLLEALALPGENYKLAFTPGLLHQVYRRPRPGQPPENLLPDPAGVLRGQGAYVDLDQDGHWWIPSGRVFYSRNAGDGPAAELGHARKHFFLPLQFRDPFGNISTVAYDAHDLATVESRDPVGNTQHAVLDYRVVSPYLMTDANRNRSQVSFDALGMVAGTAVMGKKGEDEGDTLEGFVADLPAHVILDHVHQPLRDPGQILQGATTRVVYDLFAFARTRTHAQPEPSVVYTMARETHVAALKPGEKTRVQHSFCYYDGFSREIQKKIQAAPGPLLDLGPRVDPRWIGNGWTIYNNKGKPVRRYEPFFSRTQEFEFANIVGVSPIVFYDPIERVIATVHPNHTLEKLVLDPWGQAKWDANDTVLIADPAKDNDIGGFLDKLPPADYLPTWYSQRRQGKMGAEEEAAAKKAAVHAGTPALSYFDSLGRTFLTIAQNRFLKEETPVEEDLATRTDLDIEGNQLAITDALNRRIMTYDYDMINARIRQNSVDAGERWNLNDVQAKSLRKWDSRRHEFRYHYDALRRPTGLSVQTGHGEEKLVERLVYGEEQPDAVALNLRTRLFQQFDGAGIVTNHRYDFKTNLLRNSRQLLAHYGEPEVNWSGSPPLESKVFTGSNTYDALNRIMSSAPPDRSIIHFEYNETSLLNRIKVNLRGAEVATPFATEINYNAKRQLELIACGNGARSHYIYDPLTFRLVNLKTTRAEGHGTLQDLSYTYDPMGNITFIRDAAQEDIFFKNQVVSPSNNYTYDAIYRLIGADGREHIGQLAQPQTSWNDQFRMNQPLPGDPQAMRKYHEDYQYDAVGNILEVVHQAMHGSWTRTYAYDQPNPTPANNRLTSTAVGSLNEPYSYDAHGNTVSMPHLSLMEWNFRDELRATQQRVASVPVETTYYVYDVRGQRVRKVTASASGSKTKERIYIGNAFELYREYDARGGVTLERESLHVMDDKRRVALVETKTVDTSSAPFTPNPLQRYQLENHLGSAVVELDAAGAIISFEEYYPYGSTSYQSGPSLAEVKLKRYRYTGKERDDETGFYYHGARYYAPWLGRWTSCDPAVIDAGPDNERSQSHQAGADDQHTTSSPPKKGAEAPHPGPRPDSQMRPVLPTAPPEKNASPKDASLRKADAPREQKNQSLRNAYIYAAASPVCLKDSDGMEPHPARPEDSDIHQTRPNDEKSGTPDAEPVGTQKPKVGSTGVNAPKQGIQDSANPPADTKPEANVFSRIWNWLSVKFSPPRNATPWLVVSSIALGAAALSFLVFSFVTGGLATSALAWAYRLTATAGWAVLGYYRTHKDFGLFGGKKADPTGRDKPAFDQWSWVHTLTGVLAGVWGGPLGLGITLSLLGATVAWEGVEWAGPRGWGDEESKVNKLTDIVVAMLGFLAVKALFAQSGFG